jgi:hypothetical protein
MKWSQQRSSRGMAIFIRSRTRTRDMWRNRYRAGPDNKCRDRQRYRSRNCEQEQEHEQKQGKLVHGMISGVNHVKENLRMGIKIRIAAETRAVT